ncbi:cytochrome c biogenesis CcdA family protein [Arachnia propionica]|uniref:Cytochrome c biogenesis protein CcdA n=1 Tax=Arachnia propionica TaxID=1750 RepID=A0A3P1WXT8_9ACTN|nr:cytochrome c biogenesis protein CcdA [Arachnia propionica]RRD50995.1 cytochrome c biogenesis protein CcdA [Arachnia propionica]
MTEIGLAGAFLGGLAALLSPCAAMLLPSFFAYAFGGSKRTLVGRTGLFYLGLLLTLVPLGLGAGALGALLSTHRHLMALIGGLLLVVLGIVTALGLKIPVPGLRSSGGTGPVAVVFMGAVYGLAGACTGPLLGAVLTYAAVGGSPLYGALLLACFGAGMVAPLLLLAWLWDGFDFARLLKPRPLRLGPIETSWWALIAGLLMVALGLLFLFSDATSALGGLLDASAQLRLESQLGQWALGISDVVVILVLAALAGLLVWWVSVRGKRNS